MLINVPVHLASDKSWRMQHLCEFSTYLVEEGFQDTRDFPRITPLLLILFLKENTKCILNLERGAWGVFLNGFPQCTWMEMLGLPGGTPQSLLGRGSANSSLAPGTTRRIKVMESLVGAKVPPRGS